MSNVRHTRKVPSSLPLHSSWGPRRAMSHVFTNVWWPRYLRTRSPTWTSHIERFLSVAHVSIWLQWNNEQTTRVGAKPSALLRCRLGCRHTSQWIRNHILTIILSAVSKVKSLAFSGCISDRSRPIIHKFTLFNTHTHTHTHVLFNQPIFLESLHVRPVPKNKLLGIVLTGWMLSCHPTNSISALKEVTKQILRLYWHL